MLCCLGLFLGLAVGSMLGGPWAFFGPIVGFILGFIGDMKLLRGSYGHHGGHGGGCCGGWIMKGKNEGEIVDDPVCGMRVDSRTARYKADLGGKTYYFCSSACKSAFKKNPEMYV